MMNGNENTICARFTLAELVLIYNGLEKLPKTLVLNYKNDTASNNELIENIKGLAMELESEAEE